MYVHISLCVRYHIKTTVDYYIIVTVSSISVGIMWFYWPYFKEKASIPGSLWESERGNNKYDFDGYIISDLYVNKKYNSYKMETLQHISNKEFNKNVLKKADAYMRTHKVKSLKAGNIETGETRCERYQIKLYQPISIDHIISIILYCDFSDYCSMFSSTFPQNETV